MDEVNPVERLLGAVITPVGAGGDVDGVVSKVDVDRLVNEVDLDAVLEKVDLDALLDRIDVDALLDRIDVERLLERIDVDKLTERIDVQALVDRMDVQSVISRVDVNALVEQVDVNALVDQVDVAAVARRAGIDDIVAEATTGVTARVLTLARRQIVGLDLIVSGIVAKLTRRPTPMPPSGATATGEVAGPVSRLLAFFVDFAVITFGFSVLTSVVGYLVELFTGSRYQPTEHSWGWVWAVGYALFAFVYWIVGLTVAGSSIGKALIGLRVVTVNRHPLKGRQALVRVVVYPFSFILGLGLIPIATARSHRALHDKAAHTLVLYDWGDGDIERSPLTRWLRGHTATTTWVGDTPVGPPAAGAGGPPRAPRAARPPPPRPPPPAPGGGGGPPPARPPGRGAGAPDGARRRGDTAAHDPAARVPGRQQRPRTGPSQRSVGCGGPCGQVVRQRTFNPTTAGSIPAGGTRSAGVARSAGAAARACPPPAPGGPPPPRLAVPPGPPGTTPGAHHDRDPTSQSSGSPSGLSANHSSMASSHCSTSSTSHMASLVSVTM